jgi:predicted type IV restriction endonuclease
MPKGKTQKTAVYFLSKEDQELLKTKLKQGTLWNSKDSFEKGTIASGDIVLGIVKDIELRKFKQGKKEIEQNYCTLQINENDKIIIALSTVIQSKFDSLKIGEGDKIAIEYIGEKKNYHNFEVAKL